MAYYEGSVLWTIEHIKAIEVRLDALGIPGAATDADVSKIRNIMGNVQDITVAALRATSQGATPQRHYYVTDEGIQKFFLFDYEDTTSADNGTTIVVTTDGKRYKVGSVIDLFNSPFA